MYVYIHQITKNNTILLTNREDFCLFFLSLFFCEQLYSTQHQPHSFIPLPHKYFIYSHNLNLKKKKTFSAQQNLYILYNIAWIGKMYIHNRHTHILKCVSRFFLNKSNICCDAMWRRIRKYCSSVMESGKNKLLYPGWWL